MTFVANLASFEEAASSQRQLALLRMNLLEEDNIGFAALFVPLLKNALDSWLCTVESILMRDDTLSEEKKEDDALPQQEAHLVNLKETIFLSRALQVHVAVSRFDRTLAEELGREGSHKVLSRLMQYNVSLWQEEENQDTIMELQDFCCKVAALAGGSFPLKVSPFAADDLLRRLPLRFHIQPVDDSVETSSDSQSSHNSPLVLINQVTERQSAQEDVGFGKPTRATVVLY